MGKINKFYLLAVMILIFLAGCTQNGIVSGDGLTISKFSPDFSEVGSGSSSSVSLIAKNVGEGKASDIIVSLSGLPWEIKPSSQPMNELLGADAQFGFKGEEGIVEWTFKVPTVEVTQTYNMLADLYYNYTTSSTVLFKVVNLDYVKTLSGKEQKSLPNGVQSIKTTSGPIGISVATSQTFLSTQQVPIVFEITNVGSGKVFKNGNTPAENTIDSLSVKIKGESVICPDTEKENDKYIVRLVQGKTGRLLCRLVATDDVKTMQDIIVDLSMEYRYFIEGKSTIKVLKTPYQLPFSDISVAGSTISLINYDGNNVQGKVEVNVKNRGTTSMENVNVGAFWKLSSEQSFKEMSDCTKTFGSIASLDSEILVCDINFPVGENNKFSVKVSALLDPKDEIKGNNEIILDKAFVYDATFAETIKPIEKNEKDSTVTFDIPLKIKNNGNIPAANVEVTVKKKGAETICKSSVNLPVGIDIVLPPCSITQSITDKSTLVAEIKTLQAEADKTNNVQEFTVAYQGTPPSAVPPTVGQTTNTPVITLTAATLPSGSSYMFGTWVKDNVQATLSCKDVSGTTCPTIRYCTDIINTCVPENDYTSPFVITAEGVTYVRYNTDQNQKDIKNSIVKIDKTAPQTSDIIVNIPGSGTTQLSSSPPNIIAGDVKDHPNSINLDSHPPASGIPANAVEFYLKRDDGNYWTGTSWSSSQTWLPATNDPTDNEAHTQWKSSIGLPSTLQAGTYTVQARVKTDKSGNIGGVSSPLTFFVSNS